MNNLTFEDRTHLFKISTVVDALCWGESVKLGYPNSEAEIALDGSTGELHTIHSNAAPSVVLNNLSFRHFVALCLKLTDDQLIDLNRRVLMRAGPPSLLRQLQKAFSFDQVK